MGKCVFATYYVFRQGQNTAVTTRYICLIDGNDAVVKKKTAQEWFTKFKGYIPNLTDTSRPDRQYELNNGHLKALLKKDDRQITRKSTKKTSCSHRPSTIISSPLGLHRCLTFEYFTNFLAPTKNYGLMLHLNIPPGIERHVTTMTQALHRWSEVTLVYQHVSDIKTSGALGGKFKLRVWPNLHKKKWCFASGGISCALFTGNCCSWTYNWFAYLVGLVISFLHENLCSDVYVSIFKKFAMCWISLILKLTFGLKILLDDWKFNTVFYVTEVFISAIRWISMNLVKRGYIFILKMGIFEQK